MPIRTLAVALAVALGCSHNPPSAQPAAPAAPTAKAGAQAPDAQLVQTSGAKIALADVLHQHAQTVVVFYRGFW